MPLRVFSPIFFAKATPSRWYRHSLVHNSWHRHCMHLGAKKKIPPTSWTQLEECFDTWKIWFHYQKQINLCHPKTNWMLCLMQIPNKSTWILGNETETFNFLTVPTSCEGKHGSCTRICMVVVVAIDAIPRNGANLMHLFFAVTRIRKMHRWSTWSASKSQRDTLCFIAVP